VSNFALQKYAISKSFIEMFPGLKPSTTWPMALDDLLAKLDTLELAEVFLQPFDTAGCFTNESLDFIRNNLTKLINADNELISVYEEYITKAVIALTTLKLQQGDFDELHDLFTNYESLAKQYPCFGEKILKSAFTESNCLKRRFETLLKLYKPDEPVLPIMRNYSIHDYFNISKNILFAPLRANFGNCTSVTTDSTYLYILLSGINGGLLKVGTGCGSVKGKVYLCEKLPSVDDFQYQWVFCKNKLYLKQINIDEKDLGYLLIINPETFKIEGKTKLLLPEQSKSNILKKKNENYILLSDRDKLLILILEPVINPNPQKPSNESNDVAYDIYTQLNLVLYSYQIDSYNKEDVETVEQKELIEELFVTFSQLFTKKECKKALTLNKWDFEKTVNYLIENENDIRQPLLIPEESRIIYNIELDQTILKNNRVDFVVKKNTVFDITQFDNLKWSLAEDFIIGYKMKEGSSVVFSRTGKKITEMEYKKVIDSESTEVISDSDNSNDKINNQDNSISKDLIGTYIFTDSIHLTKYDNSFCYDLINKTYYLVGNGSLVSLSVLVSHTFITTTDKLKEHISANAIYAKLNDFLNNFKHEELFERITDLFLLMNTIKPSLPWKYSNWNYYYNVLFEGIHLKESWDSGNSEYNRMLYPVDFSNINQYQVMKTLTNKIEKSFEQNAKIIKSEIGGNCKFEPYGDNKKLSKYFSTSYLRGDVDVHWSNFDNTCIIMKDNEEAINTKEINLDIRRVFFMCIDAEEKTATKILDLIDGNTANPEIIKKYLWMLYFWFESATIRLLVKDINTSLLTKIRDLLTKHYDNLEYRNVVLRILITGWEYICCDMLTQVQWIYKLSEDYKHKSLTKFCNQTVELNILDIDNVNPLYVLLDKFSWKKSLYLFHNFNRINLIKTFKIEKISDFGVDYIAKSFNHAINPSKLIFPISWLLIGHLPEEVKSLEQNSEKTENNLAEKSSEGILSFKNLDEGGLQQSDNSSLKTAFDKIKTNFYAKKIFINFSDLKDELLKEPSEQFWKFINENIADESIFQFFIDSFIFAIGSLNKKERINFLIKNVDFLKSSLNNKAINPNAILTYTTVVMNSFYNIILTSSINELEDIQIHLHSLLDTVTNIFKFKGNNNSAENLLNKLQNISGGGNLKEYEKCFEYTINSLDSPNILEKIKFLRSTAIAVEIELKYNSKENKGINWDLVIISDEHGYNNTKYNTNNNYNNFGTCFMMKLNNVISKRLYLLGDEIKIISPSDLETNRNHSKSKSTGRRDMNNVSKTMLKIKCYPFRPMSFAVKNEDEISLGNTVLSSEGCLHWLRVLKDLDYFINYVNKSLLKSSEINSNEAILNENILRLGLFNYEAVNAEEMLKKHKENKLILKKENYNTKISNEIEDLFIALNNIENCEIYSDSIKETLNLFKGDLNKIRTKIREIIPEPITYRNLKMVSSFNPKMKAIWNIVELGFILCLIYHLDLKDELDDLPTAYLDLLGKKLNILLSWMSSRAQLLKNTFDSIKHYLEMIVEMNNNYVGKLKQAIIEKLTKKDDKPIEEAKQDGTNKAEKKISKAVQDKKPTVKPINFKKKQNVKRLYQELPKKKVSKKLSDILPAEECKEELVEETVIDYSEKNLEYFTQNHLALFEELTKEDNSKTMKVEIKQKIENDIKEAYFANSENLKNILETNNLEFNETNLFESLKTYTNFIFKSLSDYFNFEDETISEIEYDKIISKLYNTSPYTNIANFVFSKLIFLLELNNISKTENNEQLDSNVLSREHSLVKKKTDEELILTPQQNNILKSIFTFLYKNNDLNKLKHYMNKQYKRLEIRQKGLKNIVKLYNNNLDRLFLHSLGGVCFSTKHDVLNGLETISQNLIVENISMSDINCVLNILIETYNDILPISIAKDFKSLSKDDSNTTDEHIQAYRLRNLNLILSDINVILKYRGLTPTINLESLDKFIKSSIDIIISFESDKKDKQCSEMKRQFSEYFRALLVKCVSFRDLSDIVIRNIFSTLDLLMNNPGADNFYNILNILYDISTNLNLSDNDASIPQLVTGISKLFDLIVKSQTYDIINLSCRICKILLNNKKLVSSNLHLFDSIFTKLGYLYTFNNTDIKQFQEGTGNNYNVIIHMNSIELDYQFLVNALYYWEEKYPTKLSIYKYNEFKELNECGVKKEKENEIIKTLGLSKSIGILVQEDQKGKVYNVFNQLKAKISKMALLDKIAQERLAGLRKAIEEANKMIAEAQKAKEEEAKLKEQKKEEEEEKAKLGLDADNSAPNTEDKKVDENDEQKKTELETKKEAEVINIDEVKERLFKLKQQEAYQLRIHNHIKTAELIGETACNRGYVTLEPALPKAQAEELAELIHKSYIRILPHFKANIDETVPLFTDDLIYPKMPEKEQLLPGCTNILKETTKPYMNVSLIEESINNKLISSYQFFIENAKLINQADEYKGKLGYYNNNFLLGYSLGVISNINYNDIKIKRLIEEGYVSGRSISMIIDEILSLVYHTYDEDKSNDFIGRLNDEIKALKGKNWNDYNDRFKLLGMLISCSGFYQNLQNYSKAAFNKNNENVCRIISGGHKSGKNSSNVIFLKEKQIKIEKVNIKDLDKIKLNRHLNQQISLETMIDLLILSYEIYCNNKDSLVNKLFLHLVLKILNEKRINDEEILSAFKSSNEKFTKFLAIIKTISNDTLWLDKEDSFWEIEFIESFERIFNKLDSKSELLYSPIFNFNERDTYTPLDPTTTDCSDMITRFQLPVSNYSRCLPKITDFSKCHTALKNLQNFDKYIVGELFNYCRSQYRDGDYQSALYQIRYHLSCGDIASAKSDMSTIFDGNRMPPHIVLPRESIDVKEISKEECYPGNYYLATLSNKFIRESSIKSLAKLSSIGINEVPVVLLLTDFTINQALVMYNDIEYGKIYTFWIGIDNLMFLEKQVKLPANCFKMRQLYEEFSYLEKRLKILYSKNILTNMLLVLVENNSIGSFDDILQFLNLSNWQSYKLSPVEAGFYSFNDFIKVKNEIGLLRSNTVLFKDDSRDIVSSCSGLQIKEGSDIVSSGKFDLDRILSQAVINGQPLVSLISSWCMTCWDSIDKDFKKLRTNLFNEYYNKDIHRSRQIFNTGNFGNRMLAIHELANLKTSDFAGLILTFEKDAYLGPQSKISFYSDPYGENLVHEIQSIKTSKYNLESIVFNYSKIWMYYTPGTRAFYIDDWYIQSRDSFLPCSIVFLPHIWPTLISLTDYYTSSLFAEVNLDSLSSFTSIIKKLLSYCTALSLPAELHRKVFNITNRIILKASKYISLLDNQKLIKLNELTISEKFGLIGIDEFSVTQLINNINSCNNSSGDKNFSSAYVVDGVEILLSILLVIKESFHTLDLYLKEMFDFSLPIWIEAIIKLGQFLGFFQGTSDLENILKTEIFEQMSLNTQWDKILIVENISGQLDDTAILNDIYSILLINGSVIVDKEKDIKVIKSRTNENTKNVFILVDGFMNNDKQGESDDEEPEEIEEEIWQCFYCSMDNDRENPTCIFCDKEKKLKPKEKLNKKSQLMRNLSINEQMTNLKSGIKGLTKLFEYDIEETDNETSEKKTVKKSYDASILQGEDFKNKIKTDEFKKTINEFLKLRLESYILEKTYISEKINLLEKSQMKIKEVEVISKLLTDSSGLENICYIDLYEKLHQQGIDFWLDEVVLEENSKLAEIDLQLMEKIRELVDLKVCEEKITSLIYPANNLRFVPANFAQINHNPITIIETYYKELREVPLSVIRYNWILIKYFNNCLNAALPFIKPPDAHLNKNIEKNDEFTHIPFPKTISAFLSSARGITFSIIKQNLIREISSYTEFNEEEVQITTFKFERLNIMSQNDKAVGGGKAASNHIMGESNLEEDNGNNQKEELKTEESIFLQAYEQAKDVDVAFFRCKKMPGDPHVAFKVEFRGELVQGIGGPYRQFFSDISAELQSKDYKNKKSLKLLHPTTNNKNSRGEFKDKYTITPSNNSNSALCHYEFLGIIMGICIRTGVHLTLDLCSIIWKKIVNNY
jgi:hypothetical protein